MSHVMAEGDASDTRRDTDGLAPAECVTGSVFVAFVPLPRAFRGCPVSEPRVRPPGEKIPFFWHAGCICALCELL